MTNKMSCIFEFPVSLRVIVDLGPDHKPPTNMAKMEAEIKHNIDLEFPLTIGPDERDGPDFTGASDAFFGSADVTRIVFEWAPKPEPEQNSRPTWSTKMRMRWEQGGLSHFVFSLGGPPGPCRLLLAPGH